ncbi:Galactan 5-O-arabinofuranosyltransferase [Mycobacterium talmoniae]|uniref:Galactan 5-O-arabinofuranosyltransferase n=1 Tax=Mycobacterium talmoniae TaxID=1858794 RepID=A0A2S8BSL3_9MYCO|nr:Galactan 5-O-arabinofuranosyltransferase [Mycobacterium talmoniae]
MRNALASVGQMILAAAIALAVAVISLIAIARVEWPAYPSSNQLHALTTVGQVGCIAGLIGAGWLWRRGRRRVAQLSALVFVSAFSVVTLAMPLGATKLYLFGISVDQQFRTEYLTRLTDSPALRDMTYLGLPPFYPPGWFWLGGRAAALTGTPGWEMYKPWAITSITIAVAVALVLWTRLIRFELAVTVTAATAAVTLAYSSPEPYAAMITVLLPPVLVLTWSGLRAAGRTLTAETESGDRHADEPVAGFPLAGASRRVAPRLGRNRRRRHLPGLRGHLLHPAGGLQRVHRHADGRGAGRGARAPKRTQSRPRPAGEAGDHRCDRGGHRVDHLAAVRAARRSATDVQHRQRLSLSAARRPPS